MIRYTEKDYKTDINGPLDYIKYFFVLVCVAPFRLCNELSLKLVYVKKSIIEKCLFASFGIACLEFVIYCIIRYLSNNFSIMNGRFPVIIRLLGVGVVGALAIIYYRNDFSAYNRTLNLLNIRLGKQQDDTDSEYEEKTDKALFSKNKERKNTVTSNSSTTEYPKNIQVANRLEFEETSNLFDDNVNEIDLAVEEDAKSNKISDDKKLSDEFFNELFSSIKEDKPIGYDSHESDIKVPEYNRNKENNKEEVVSESKNNDVNKNDNYLERLPQNTVNKDNFDLVNVKLLGSKKVINYQDRIQNSIDSANVDYSAISNFMSANELEELEDNMEASTDPSKYLNERLLCIFEESLRIDQFGIIECIDISCVPDSFNFTA